jgi:hypothetical protein
LALLIEIAYPDPVMMVPEVLLVTAVAEVDEELEVM